MNLVEEFKAEIARIEALIKSVEARLRADLGLPTPNITPLPAPKKGPRVQ